MTNWWSDHGGTAIGLFGILLQLVGFGWTVLDLVANEHASGTSTASWLRRRKRDYQRAAAFLVGREKPDGQNIVLGAAHATLGALALSAEGSVTRSRPDNGTPDEEFDALWRNIEILREDIQGARRAQERDHDALRDQLKAEAKERTEADAEIKATLKAQSERQIDVSSVAVLLFTVGTLLTAVPLIW